VHSVPRAARPARLSREASVAAVRRHGRAACEARNGAQVLVNGLEVMIGHVWKGRPRHNLEKVAVEPGLQTRAPGLLGSREVVERIRKKRLNKIAREGIFIMAPQSFRKTVRASGVRLRPILEGFRIKGIPCRPA